MGLTKRGDIAIGRPQRLSLCTKKNLAKTSAKCCSAHNQVWQAGRVVGAVLQQEAWIVDNE
ncbi:unnamed protein product, partial [Dovyalis caffra]